MNVCKSSGLMHNKTRQRKQQRGTTERACEVDRYEDRERQAQGTACACQHIHAAPHLQHLRQVEVVQRHNRRDAGGMQLLQQPAVKAQPSCVGLAAAAAAR